MHNSFDIIYRSIQSLQEPWEVLRHLAFCPIATASDIYRHGTKCKERSTVEYSLGDEWSQGTVTFQRDLFLGQYGQACSTFIRWSKIDAPSRRESGDNRLRFRFKLSRSYSRARKYEHSDIRILPHLGHPLFTLESIVYVLMAPTSLKLSTLHPKALKRHRLSTVANPSCAKLPYDIWLYITSFLDCKTVRKLYSINRELFDIAMDERYREACIGYHSTDPAMFACNWQKAWYAANALVLEMCWLFHVLLWLSTGDLFRHLESSICFSNQEHHMEKNKLNDVFTNEWSSPSDSASTRATWSITYPKQ